MLKHRWVVALGAAFAWVLAALLLGSSPAGAAGAGDGYIMIDSNGGVTAFGTLTSQGSLSGAPLNSPIVDGDMTSTGKGYVFAAADGGVFAFGDAVFAGSAAGFSLKSPIVAIDVTPSGKGYLLAAADGGVFAFGDAKFLGSMGGIRLRAPVVDIAMTPDGNGYRMAAADGGVFAFGNAPFGGSAVGLPLRGAIVAIESAKIGTGYGLLGLDGGVFAYNGFGFHGSMANTPLAAPIVEMVPSVTGFGYTLLGLDGGAFAFGDAPFVGSLVGKNLPAPIVAIIAVTSNKPPVAGDDAAGTPEDTALSAVAPGPLANDSDPENDALKATVKTAPANGTVTLAGSGAYTYTPNLNFNGTDSFEYTVTDSFGLTDVGKVTVTVGAVNDAPDAAADTLGVGEDAPAGVAVLANDTDADAGDTLSVTATSTPAQGSVAINPDHTITYTPGPGAQSLAAGQTLNDSFTYTVTDSGGLTDSGTVSVTITGANDLPVADDDAATALEDGPAVTVDVRNGDTDVDASDTLSVTAVDTTGTTGTVTNGGTDVSYNPGANFQGLDDAETTTDTFTYTVSDGKGGADVGAVTMTIHGLNDAPVAGALSPTANEDTPAVVTLSGTDADVENLVPAIVTGPANGTLSAIGATSCAGTCTAPVTYTPNADFNGTDSFTYKVLDGTTESAAATVTVTVVPVNDAPSFTKGADATSVQDTGAKTVAGWATAMSNGPANESGQTLTFNVTADNPALFAVAPAVDPTTGDLTYTAAPATIGSSLVRVTLKDNGGTALGGVDTSPEQTFTINIVPPNDTPVAAAATASGNEDGGPITATLSGTDADGDALTFTAGTATNGLVTVPSGTTCDGLTPSACTATVKYTPNADFYGTDSFTYTVNDGTVTSLPATVTVTVNAVNDAPSFTKGADQTVNEDAGAQSVSGWATAISTGPANESGQTVTIERLGTTNDALFSALPAVDATGTLTYTPVVNANGSAVVTMRAVDDGGTANGGVGTGSNQTFTITVTAVNDVPSFTKGADQTVNEDAGAQSVSNWATAISKGPADESAQDLAFTSSNDNNSLFSLQPGMTPTGTLVYTPAPNAVGSATVTVYLADTGGTANGGVDTSPSQTFTITVNPVNDAPSFTKGSDVVVLEDSGASTVATWSTARSAGPADESAQTVTVERVSTSNDAAFSVLPTVNSSGDLAFTPAADANGVVTVTMRAVDDGGTANGGSATGSNETFTITITPVNDAPSFAAGANQTVNEDAGAQSVSGWATSLSAGPANESAQTLSFEVTDVTNSALFSAGPAVSPAGVLTYTSAANKWGSSVVTLRIKDSGGTANNGVDASPTQQFSIVVNAVNDAPTAAAKSYTVQANMKISLGGLLVGAADPSDVAGDAAWTPSFTLGSITVGAGCIGCTVSNVDNANGTFDLDPPAGGTGTYTLSYTVVDNGHPAPGATSAGQTITVTVNGPVVWFVNTAAGAGGTGRLSAPFNTLPSATTAMGTSLNHRIFVTGGNVSGNVTLPTDGWLVSDAATGTNFDSVMGFTPPAGTIARPTVNGANQRTLTGGVTLGANSVVRGFDLTPASGTAGLVGSNKTGLVVNQMSITTTNARAVDLAGSSGVFSLKRVQATGASNGISLVNTNVSTGSFTVTGEGSTADSGGVISGSTSDGINLNNTKNVALSNMRVTSGSATGILGQDVTTFSLANSTVSNNGTNETLDHAGLRFVNLLGTSSLSSVTVFGSREDNASVTNTSGTANLTVSNSTFRDNNASVGANGLLINAMGSSNVTFTSSNNTFERNRTSGLAVFGQSTVKTNATVTGGTYVTDNGVGLDIETNGPGGLQFSVNGGTVTGCATCASPVVVYKGTGATGTGSNATAGTVTGMTVTNGGSMNAPGIWVHGEGPGAARLAITNNNVSQVGHYGILVSFGNNGAAPNLGTQPVDVTVSGNTVNHTGVAGSINGIFVDSGLLAADTTSMCANITGNQISQPAVGMADIRVRNRQAGTSFRLPGYSGSATDMTAVQNYILSQNSTPPGAVLDAQAGHNASNAGFAGGASCATP